MTTGQGTEAPPASPVTIEGRLDADLSRWLWVVKWLLAIPHYVVLAFLWLAFLVLTVVAFFAILVTGRYPRGIFDFNVGVLRWTWRVAFYSYGALGTDRYPPFTLHEAPDYPATLGRRVPRAPLARPRARQVVAPGDPAVPAGRDHGRRRVFRRIEDGRLAVGRRWRAASSACSSSSPGLALVFTGRYPGGIFDFVLGLDRWVARVVAYAGLMTDRYPPFRLDQGGTEPRAAGPAGVETLPVAEVTAPAAERGRGGRIVLLVLGSIAALFAFATLAGGCALVAIDQTQRDDDGFLMSPSEELSTPTYAIVSESAELDTGGAEWALDTFLGTVRIRSESERPVFVGIARRIDVERYLGNVERDAVSDFDGDPRYERAPGEAPQGEPGAQTFWVATASGTGEQTLEWEPEEGFWQVVLMNEDGSRGVSSEVSIGAELDSVLWVGLGLLGVGALLAALAALAVTAGIRRGRRPGPEPQGAT